MKPLPNLLRKVPFLFYGAAALFFVWYLVNAWFGLTMGASTAFSDPAMGGYVNLQKSNTLYAATLEAVYLIGYGATVHVLLAIYDRIAPAKGDAE